MSFPSSFPATRAFVFAAATFIVAAIAQPARANFHLWALNEIYTNNTGSLQFIELQTPFGSQNLVNGETLSVTSGGTTHSFTIPGNALGGDTTNHFLLLGTAGLQAAGGPAPDYIIPTNFLFSGGGSISFFGSNSGTYTALPTDGIHSRNWAGGDIVNSPTNYAGQTGTVPAPATIPLAAAAGWLAMGRRRAKR
jgi:uncharacterized protein (TIGR03382 family)